MALKDMKEIEKIDRQRAVGDNMNGEKRADDKLEAGMKFRDFKNMPGKTITEKLQKAGIKNIPKTLTLEKAIELLNKKRAN
jgi:hypothetical protein